MLFYVLFMNEQHCRLQSGSAALFCDLYVFEYYL